MAGELRGASWLQWRHQAVSAGGPDGEPWFLLERGVQWPAQTGGAQSSAAILLHPVRGSSHCLGPSPGWAAWIGALHTGDSGRGKGKLGETSFVIFSPRYNGKKSTSNMVILEVSLLTGFALAPGSGMSVRSVES